MIWHNVQQNTDEWSELRIGKFTMSNSALVMANENKSFGDPARRYALQLALERITGNKAEFSFSNIHMERGHEQEPIARELYQIEKFVDVTNGGFFDHETYGDSPDGLVGNDGLIEIKSVTASVHYATITRKAHDPVYHWQLIGHLECSGREWVDFISYCADFPDYRQLVIHRLYKDDYQSDIERLRKRRADFLSLVDHIKDDLSP